MMSRMRPLTLGVKTMMFTMHFVVATVVPGTLRLPLNGKKFPPSVCGEFLLCVWLDVAHNLAARGF